MLKKFLVFIVLIGLLTSLGCAATPSKPQDPDCPKKSKIIMLDESDKE
jgi:hypothetical protein